MRILVVSDTHRYNNNLYKVIESLGKLDMVIHCGDAEGTEEQIRAKLNCPMCIVEGNNDYYSNLPKEAFFEAEGKKIYVTHGHYHHVNMGTERLISEAQKKGADIVIFGHTHCPKMEKKDGIVVLNPGSISYPRQMDRKPTYIVIESDNNGNMRYTLNYVKR